MIFKLYLFYSILEFCKTNSIKIYDSQFDSLLNEPPLFKLEIENKWDKI